MNKKEMAATVCAELYRVTEKAVEQRNKLDPHSGIARHYRRLCRKPRWELEELHNMAIRSWESRTSLTEL